MARTFPADQGPLAEPKNVLLNEYMIIEDHVHKIHKIIVHRFRMGDVEDPDLYAANPIWQWQQTDMGKFVMERSVETPMWHRRMNTSTYGYEYAIEAWLKGADYTFWVLKWGGEVDRKDPFNI
jgi:hypothetical protein